MTGESPSKKRRISSSTLCVSRQSGRRWTFDGWAVKTQVTFVPALPSTREREFDRSMNQAASGLAGVQSSMAGPLA